jgi:hypothetical protein
METFSKAAFIEGVLPMRHVSVDTVTKMAS